MLKSVLQNPARKYFLLALGIILLDQAVKVAVKLSLPTEEPGNTIPLLGNFFKIYFTENKGAAFGMTFQSLLGDDSEDLAKLLLTLISLGLVGLVGWFLTVAAKMPTRLPLFIAMILGGAVGNIIDRVFYGVWFAGINDYEGGLLYGRVVDMFYFDLWSGYVPDNWPIIGGEYYTLWPVFNIADVAISVGILAILLFQKRLFGAKAPAAAPAANG